MSKNQHAKDYIIAHWADKTVEELAKELNMTVGSISRTATNLRKEGVDLPSKRGVYHHKPKKGNETIRVLKGKEVKFIRGADGKLHRDLTGVIRKPNEPFPVGTIRTHHDRYGNPIKVVKTETGWKRIKKTKEELQAIREAARAQAAVTYAKRKRWKKPIKEAQEEARRLKELAEKVSKEQRKAAIQQHRQSLAEVRRLEVQKATQQRIAERLREQEEARKAKEAAKLIYRSDKETERRLKAEQKKRDKELEKMQKALQKAKTRYTPPEKVKGKPVLKQREIKHICTLYGTKGGKREAIQIEREANVPVKRQWLEERGFTVTEQWHNQAA